MEENVFSKERTAEFMKKVSPKLKECIMKIEKGKMKEVEFFERFGTHFVSRITVGYLGLLQETYIRKESKESLMTRILNSKRFKVGFD